MTEAFPSAGPPSPRRALVDVLVAESATRGERALSAVRGMFCLAVLARFLLIGGLEEGTPLRATMTVGSIALAVMVSGLLLWRARRRSLARRELVLSVSIDAGVCFAALLPNVLWPWPGYRGLFATPDAAALLLVAVAAGFRLYPTVTFASGALQGLSFVALAVLDVRLNGAGLEHAREHISFFGILLLGAVALAALLGTRTLRLARAAARRATEAERARHALAALLQEHHDVRSFLSSATLSSDVMLRDLSRAGGEHTAPLRQIAVDLREDLLQMHRLVSAVKDRADIELAALEPPATTAVAPVLARVMRAVSRRFPDTRLVVDDVAPGAGVRVVGGAAGLERVLLNLLVNACEGDGERGAESAMVHVVLRDERVVLRIDDDGPGFSAEVLAGRSRWSTKAQGSGLGLLLTASLVEASGGSLTRENLPQGGARVTVELPAAVARD